MLWGSPTQTKSPRANDFLTAAHASMARKHVWRHTLPKQTYVPEIMGYRFLPVQPYWGTGGQRDSRPVWGYRNGTICADKASHRLGPAFAARRLFRYTECLEFHGELSPLMS